MRSTEFRLSRTPRFGPDLDVHVITPSVRGSRIVKEAQPKCEMGNLESEDLGGKVEVAEATVRKYSIWGGGAL